jgi:hypothetical protein
MTNIVFVNQGGKNFLFAVPKNVTLKKGDRVLCNTMRGEQEGICATGSFSVDEHALKQIADLVGAYFPLKSVVGKVEFARFDKAITEDKLIPHLLCMGHNYGTIGTQTKYNDVLGRPLFVGDTVDLYSNGIFRGERAVVQPSVSSAAGKQFIMGIEALCNDKNGVIEDGYKILKNRSHADVKNGTIVDGVKYIKE